MRERQGTAQRLRRCLIGCVGRSAPCVGRPPAGRAVGDASPRHHHRTHDRPDDLPIAEHLGRASAGDPDHVGGGGDEDDHEADARDDPATTRLDTVTLPASRRDHSGGPADAEGRSARGAPAPAGASPLTSARMPRRILIAKPGLDGHDRGPRSSPGRCATRLRGHLLRPLPDPEQIVETACRKMWRHRPLPALRLSHDLFPRCRALRERDAADIVVFAAASSPKATSPLLSRRAWPRSSPGCVASRHRALGGREHPGVGEWTSSSSRASRCWLALVCRCPRAGWPALRGGGAAAAELGRSVVVKAQVQVGGRGKAGASRRRVACRGGEAASAILGMGDQGHGWVRSGWSRRWRSPPSTTPRSRSTGAWAGTWAS